MAFLGLQTAEGMEPVSFASTEIVDHRVVITLADQVSAEGLPELRWHMHDLVLAGARTIVVDLSASAVMGSSALAALLGAHRACRARGGSVVLRNPNRQVMDLMYRTGLWRVLQIEGPQLMRSKEA